MTPRRLQLDAGIEQHDANHRANAKPWLHRSGNVYNVTESGHSGEVQTLLNLFMLLLVLCGMAAIGKWVQRSERLKRQRHTINSMLGADEAAERGVEMSDMNAAAEEAQGAEEESRDGMLSVREELSKLRLTRYADAFDANGYDMWGEILRLPPYRVAKLIELVDMQPNHADRFQEALVSQRRQHKIAQVLPVGTSGGDACAIL